MAGLFGPKPVSQMAPALTSLQLQTSCWGRVIPLVYGMQRVAPNLIWYGDFVPTANTTKQGGKGGSGGGSTTSYTYKTAVALALCAGTVTGTDLVWAGRDVTTLANLNLALFGGALGQAPPAYMTTNHSAEALGYSDLAYFFSSAYDLGSSPNLPSHSFEVKAKLYDTAAPGQQDAALSQIIADLMLQAGVPSSLYASMTDMASYCQSLGLWASPAYTDQAPAAQMIERLLEIGNTALIASDGVFKFIPYADADVSGYGASYTAPVTVQYDLTDDDFLHADGEDPVRISRSDPTDAFNQITVQFKDRYEHYAANVASAEDAASVALLGPRPHDGLTYDEIAWSVTAKMVATLRLQRMTYSRNIYSFRVGAHYARLEPMDLVRLTESTGTGLSLVTVRITRIVENTNHELEIEAEDFFGTVGNAPAYEYQVPGGYRVDYNADPGDVSPPMIFDAPYELCDTGFELFLAVGGMGALWGGATVWMSTDAATYKPIGNINGPARYGALTAAVGVGADPDTVSAVNVNLSISKGELSSGTTADADNATTLCIMGREVFAYQTATLTGTNSYSLATYLRRGLYRSERVAHSSGENFARIDSSIVNIPYEKSRIGQTVYFKFTSFNVWEGGQQELSTVTAYPYLIQGPIGGIPGEVSLLDSKAWKPGSSGSQGGFRETPYPTTGVVTPVSSVVLAGSGGEPLGPANRILPLWKWACGGTTGYNGWTNTKDLYGVNPDKSYRVSVWARWNGVGRGYFELGAPSNVQNLTETGSTPSLGVFWAFQMGADIDSLIIPNRWYLIAGFIHARNSVAANSGKSGVYDGVTGRRVQLGYGVGYGPAIPTYDDCGSDFRWNNVVAIVPNGAHKVQVIGDGTAGNIIWMADPRFDEVNGNEPSIGTLMVPQNVDSGLSARIVPDVEFSLSSANADFWRGLTSVIAIVTSGGEYAGYPSAVGGYLKFSGAAGTVISRRLPDNNIVVSRKVTVTVRYRRHGTLTPISGTSLSLVYGYRAYTVPDDPTTSPQGNPSANTTVALVTASVQQLTNDVWYTSSTEFTLDNNVSGNVCPFFCIELTAGGYSAGELQIDSISAEYTG